MFLRPRTKSKTQIYKEKRKKKKLKAICRVSMYICVLLFKLVCWRWAPVSGVEAGF